MATPESVDCTFYPPGSKAQEKTTEIDCSFTPDKAAKAAEKPAEKPKAAAPAKK